MMTRRATFTQAELERAIRAARKLDAEVEVAHGKIRIVEPASGRDVPSDDEGENPCDAAFGI